MSESKYHQERLERPLAPAGCPVLHDWSPLNDDYLAEPYGIAAALRDDYGTFYAESLGCLVVTKIEDIEAIFADHETFASVNVQDPVFPLSAQAKEILSADDFDPVAVMSNRPEPDHGKIRVYTRAGFSNKRIKTLIPYIKRRTHELVDEMLAAGSPAEFVDALAFPLPGETVFRFIGFPESDDAMLKQWCGDRKAFSWGRTDADQQAEIANQMLSYWRYCRDFTASKRDRRGVDFASELIDAHEANPDDMSYREVESVIYGLSFAGHEAVTALICNTLQCLLPRREVWLEICADPSLIPNAIEEVLRFNSSQISWRRLTTRDTRVAGYDVPAGTAILMNFASANRQADRWDNPDKFDIHRPNANRHISFGKGVHFCLGAKFAKLEAQLVTEILAERIPSLRLVANQGFDYVPNITFRGPTELQVAWD
ncbi:MAG: cytochrome P450 [Actinobacteria bacterium]|nr:cytochrome P450 [Actinomycetota bacterium]